MLKQTVIEGVYLPNCPYIYGSIEKISDLSDMFSNSDIGTKTVLFNGGISSAINLNDQLYFLTTEDNIRSTFINTFP